MVMLRVSGNVCVCDVRCCLKEDKEVIDRCNVSDNDISYILIVFLGPAVCFEILSHRPIFTYIHGRQY